MKSTILHWLFLMVCMAGATTANASNRYAVASGRWNETRIWSMTSGGAAGASIPTMGDTVYIAEGVIAPIITIPEGYNATCSMLQVGAVTSNSASGSVEFSAASSSLTVSGNVTIMAVTMPSSR